MLTYVPNGPIWRYSQLVPIVLTLLFIQTEMVYQQIRALAVLDTAAARQKGYPLRVSFSEFLRRFVRHPTPTSKEYIYLQSKFI